jgi:hypothetical protein
MYTIRRLKVMRQLTICGKRLNLGDTVFEVIDTFNCCLPTEITITVELGKYPYYVVPKNSVVSEDEFKQKIASN